MCYVLQNTSAKLGEKLVLLNYPLLGPGFTEGLKSILLGPKFVTYRIQVSNKKNYQ